MRLVTFVLLLSACGEVRQTHRWPDHRRQKDDAISALEQKAVTLEQRVQKLETELAKLQPQPAAALPSPSP